MPGINPDVFTDTLEALSEAARSDLLALFDSLPSYDEAAASLFHDAAKPIARAAAQASADLTTAYLSTIIDSPPPPSSLTIEDAAARMYDPFERIGRNLANGMSNAEAVAAGRSQVDALATDTVYRTARTGMAEQAFDMNDWQRRLRSDCCQWCMKLSSVVFDTAGQATFGHPHCKCIAFPVSELGDHNLEVRKAEGFDAEAEKLWDQRKARRRLRESIANSQKRSAQAAADASRAMTPERRDVLETRAQEWETRAEAAAERLRIMETGTHRLAA